MAEEYVRGAIVGVLGLALLAGCSGKVQTNSSDSGAPDASVHDASADLSVPDSPGPDAFSPRDGGPDVVPPPVALDGGANFAFHEVFLGDTDRMFNEGATAWMLYGLNVDGLTTTLTSTNVCTLYPGAPTNVQVDGPSGIDNSWGENIIPILTTSGGANVSQTYSAEIASGAFTYMIDVNGLTTSAAQTALGTPAQFFVGDVFPGTPTFTTADIWPVRPEFLLNGQTVAGGSTIQFPSGAIDGGTWSSGMPMDIPLTLVFSGQSLPLTVHHGVFLFSHSAPNQATNGILSGVLNAQELVNAFVQVAGSISTSLCSGSAIESIEQEILQASDIMTDGTNAPGENCDGISIGIGFSADEIAQPQTVGPPGVPASNPCDAGSD